VGFLNNFFSKLIAFPNRAQSANPSSARPVSTSGITVTVSYSGATLPGVIISESDVSDAVERYDFVLKSELQPLKAADRWFDETMQKRRLRDGSEKVYNWLLPFLPLEVARLEQLSKFLAQGPISAGGVVAALRALIRERRRAKQAFDDLVHALYNSCILWEFTYSLAFENIAAWRMTRCVDIRELQQIRIDYSSMGYQWIQGISKSDVKLFVEVIGEPREHKSFDDLWPHIRQNAVSRYCWGELGRENEFARRFHRSETSINVWVRDLVRSNLEFQARTVASEAKQTARIADLEAGWAAMQVPFAVADLETTGLNADSSEILEIAAVLVEPDGSIISEFSVLVKPEQRLPSDIIRLTGITQVQVDEDGQPLSDALVAFLNHIGGRPVFFHNAPFDQRFLSVAFARSNIEFNNAVYDTLPLARHAWSSLVSYSLGALAKHIGATPPNHRALGDAQTALAVLLAARASSK